MLENEFRMLLSSCPICINYDGPNFYHTYIPYFPTQIIRTIIFLIITDQLTHRRSHRHPLQWAIS